MNEYITQICDNGNIAVDDTILVKDAVSTAGSRILDGFKPLFSAEAVTRIQDKGYTVSGKTATGEFGLDLVGEFSYYAPQEGTLKGAAAELVAKGDVKAALGVDMNGATRRAAALSGVDFLKPTYGTVSRYGVISCAASGEQLGVYAKNADGIKEIMDVIAGHDDKDGTSLPKEQCSRVTANGTQLRRVALLSSMTAGIDGDVANKLSSARKALEAAGVEVCDVEDKVIALSRAAWNVLMSAELCNNVSRYDGVKYGHRAEQFMGIDELYTNSRTEAFGALLKKAILFGSETLSTDNYMKVYDKSLRMRRVIVEAFEALFASYDAVLMPATSTMAYSEDALMADPTFAFVENFYTSPASITGLPAVVSGGVQLVGKAFSEPSLLMAAKILEKEGN